MPTLSMLNVGGGGMSFRGALVQLLGSQDMTGSIQPIVWNSVVYDTSGFWDGGQPTRLTVPAGIDRVRLTGQVGWRFLSVLRGQGFTKNAATAFEGMAWINLVAGAQNGNFSSAVLEVVPGDYFEMRATVEAPSSDTLEQVLTHFSIEALP